MIVQSSGTFVSSTSDDGGHLEVLVVPVVRPRGPRQLEPAGEGILQLALALLSITLRTHHTE